MAQFLRSFTPLSVVLLLLSEAVLVTGCFVLAHFMAADPDPWGFFLYEEGLLPTSLAVVSILGGLYFVDLYTHVQFRSSTWLVQQLSLVLGMAFLVQAFVGYLNPSLILPKWIMIGGSALTFFAVCLWRTLYSRVLLRYVASERVLFVGTDPILQEIALYLGEHPELGAVPDGYVAPAEVPEMTAAAGPWRGVPPSLRDAARLQRSRQVVVGMQEEREGSLLPLLLDIRFGGCLVEDAAAAYERIFGRVLIYDLSATELVVTGRLGPGPVLQRVQWAVSVLAALVGILLTGPIMVLTALAVKFTSKGPVFFQQVRLGLNGKPFKVIKFRSMYVGSDRMTAPRKGDPRITPVGHWIRKLRFDELPQFFNVLRGDMYMVGPRPELPEFTEVFVQKLPLYRYRLLVKPGITGWAQINHRQEYSLEDTVRKLGFDLYYLKNASLALDLYVMFQTAKVMLLSRGAR